MGEEWEREGVSKGVSGRLIARSLAGRPVLTVWLRGCPVWRLFSGCRPVGVCFPSGVLGLRCRSRLLVILLRAPVWGNVAE